MDLDTVIYIIVTVVIFIASLVGNKKPKPLPPQTKEEEIDYSLNEFEKILERKEEFAQAQTVRHSDEDVVQEEQSLMEEYKQEIELAKQEPEIKKEEPENKPLMKEEEEEADDGFDLNSAIIYSSILERKKYRH